MLSLCVKFWRWSPSSRIDRATPVHGAVGTFFTYCSESMGYSPRIASMQGVGTGPSTGQGLSIFISLGRPQNLEQQLSSTNIEQFNELTGQIFACLYEAFPIPISLRPSMLGIDEHEGGEYSPEVGKVLGVEPQSAEEIIFKHSVTWLLQASYINATQVQFDSHFFSNVRLTAKGLEVLNAIPENLVQKESLGTQLASASKSGAKELIRTITTEVLGVGIRMNFGS